MSTYYPCRRSNIPAGLHTGIENMSIETTHKDHRIRRPWPRVADIARAAGESVSVSSTMIQLPLRRYQAKDYARGHPAIRCDKSFIVAIGETCPPVLREMVLAAAASSPRLFTPPL